MTLEFVRSFSTDFSFQSPTRIKFEVKHERTGAIIGSAESDVAKLVALNGGVSSLPLEGVRESPISAIEVQAESTGRIVNSVRFSVKVEPHAAAVQRIEGRMVKYYMTVSRFVRDESVSIFRSEAIPLPSSGVLDFGSLSLTTEKLCRGDPWRPIEVRVVANSLVGKRARSVQFAHAQFSYADMERASDSKRAVYLNLLSPVETSPFAGTVSITVSEIAREFSFLDYIKAGLEINVMVGIDMTRSNGDPRSSSSLHAFTQDGVPGPSNEYARVIESVVGILAHYDSDKRFPLFGFGAKLPPNHTRTSHCFALNGDYFHPEVFGVPGILEAYRNALGVVTPHGPTQVGELLRVAAEWAAPLEGQAKYLVLLVITDGAMEGFHATVAQIIAMARLPVSIIFVGVGEADFTCMHALDGDHKPLTHAITHDEAARDIVQFVPFREFRDAAASKLAAACLDELPREVVGFFGAKSIFPARNGVGFTGLAVAQAEDEDGPRTPRFLDTKRTELLVTIHNQGYDEEVAERIVKQTGILCPDAMHVIDVMFHLRKRKRGHIPKISDSGQISIADRLNVDDILAPNTENEPQPPAAAVTSERRASSSNSTGLCRVCFTRAIDVQLVPCGHKIVCTDCASKIGRLCPLCRATVDSSVSI